MNEERLFAKCAWRLIPFMTALYVVNYLDRVNAGFAALTMNADLGFSATTYGFTAGLLFAGYLMFQVPASIVLGKLGPRRALVGIMMVWGVLSASTSLVRGPISFGVLRFVLGAAEAGFFPLMALYLTQWFPRSYRTRVIASFMAAIPLGSVTGGLLSGFILGMNGMAGLAGWQWLFLLEGLPACILGLAVFHVLPESPARAAWLTADEKQTISDRVVAEDIALHREVLPALLDPRVLALGFVNFSTLFGVYGVQLWLPQIVQAMGFSNMETGFISSLPFLVALPVMILWGRDSDRKDERARHVAIPALFAAGGFFVVSLVHSDAVSLLAIAAALVGLLSMQPIIITLLSSFLGGRAVASGVALVLCLSNVGSFLGPWLVGMLKDRTGGYSVSMAMFGIVLIGAAFTVLAVGRSLGSGAPAQAQIAPPSA